MLELSNNGITTKVTTLQALKKSLTFPGRLAALLAMLHYPHHAHVIVSATSTL